jgi:TFIIH basal transcription factor complex TTD-A subunit
MENLQHSSLLLVSTQTSFLRHLSDYSDPAMKQFLLHLDETLALGSKFILQDLDETHLFISSDIVETLQARVDDLMDQLSIPVHDKGL